MRDERVTLMCVCNSGSWCYERIPLTTHYELCDCDMARVNATVRFYKSVAK